MRLIEAAAGACHHLSERQSEGQRREERLATGKAVVTRLAAQLVVAGSTVERVVVMPAFEEIDTDASKQLIQSDAPQQFVVAAFATSAFEFVFALRDFSSWGHLFLLLAML